MQTFIALLLIGSFAALLTTHMAILATLLQREPRWRGLLALVPPLAPLAVYWAFKEKLRVRAVLWLACLLTYGAALLAAYRLPGS